MPDKNNDTSNLGESQCKQGLPAQIVPPSVEECCYSVMACTLNPIKAFRWQLHISDISAYYPRCKFLSLLNLGVLKIFLRVHLLSEAPQDDASAWTAPISSMSKPSIDYWIGQQFFSTILKASLWFLAKA